MAYRPVRCKAGSLPWPPGASSPPVAASMDVSSKRLPTLRPSGLDIPAASGGIFSGVCCDTKEV